MDYRQHYLVAAKAIANDTETFSCNALRRSNTTEGHNACQLYEQVMFQLDSNVSRRGFVNYMVNAAHEVNVSSADLRVLCLCVMAACWKDFV